MYSYYNFISESKQKTTSDENEKNVKQARFQRRKEISDLELNNLKTDSRQMHF